MPPSRPRAPSDEFEGVINRTEAESTPWWPTPAHPGDGAPNVVVILLDDTGFAHFGCYGSELSHAEHRPAGRGRSALHQLPRHPAVLPHPGLAAHRPEPPHRRDALPLQLRQRLPPHAGPHHQPRRHRGRGTQGRGLRHLRPRQVAPVQHGERVGRRPLRPVAVPARVRPVLRVPRRRDRPVLSGAGLRQPQRRAAGHSRRGVPPERGPGRPRPGLHPRHHVHPSRPALLHLPGLRRHARAPPGAGLLPREVPGPVRRRVGRGPRPVVRPPARDGAPPRRHRSRAPQPGRGAVGHPARQPASAGRPPAGGVRRLPRTHRRPDRTAGRRAGAAGPAGQHPGDPALGQRGQPGGRAVRRHARDEVLQLPGRDARRGGRPDRRHRRAPQPRQLPVGLGPGRQHPVQVVQAEHP